MVKKRADADGGETWVRVTGAATVRVVNDLHSQLAEAMRSGHPVGVDITGVERIDLSVVQLLLSASRTASEAGVKFTLLGDPEMVASAVAGAPEVQRLWSE